MIDMICQRMDVPYDVHQLEAYLWRLPGSLLRLSIHSSSQAYLDGGLVSQEIDG